MQPLYSMRYVVSRSIATKFYKIMISNNVLKKNLVKMKCKLFTL